MASAKRTLLIASGLLLCLSGCIGNGNSTRKDSTESFVIKLIWDCAKTDDMNVCLKSKAAKLLGDVVRMKEPIVITEYVSLARDPKIKDVDQDMMETGRENSSAEVDGDRSEELDRIIWNRLTALFRTRTVQLSMPSTAFTGRDKESKIFKKGHGFFLMAAMMSGMMMKMALGKIALIAGKALVIGKIALVLSLILALRRIGGGAAAATQAEVVYAPPEHIHGARSWKSNSIPEKVLDGSEMAYNAHRFAAL